MKTLSLFLVALALASCSGDKKVKPKPGDPAVTGDPGGQTGDTQIGDPIAGDTVSGDPSAGDPAPGDPSPGDAPIAAVLTESKQFCAAGGQVSSSSYHGTVCLSPPGGGGPIGTSTSYKWIPGPAHIVEAE